MQKIEMIELWMKVKQMIDWLINYKYKQLKQKQYDKVSLSINI